MVFVFSFSLQLHKYNNLYLNWESDGESGFAVKAIETFLISSLSSKSQFPFPISPIIIHNSVEDSEIERPIKMFLMIPNLVLCSNSVGLPETKTKFE